MVEDPREVKKEIVSYYERLYTETEEWRPQLEMEDYPTISVEDNLALMAPLGSQEVYESIKACGGDKAPGRDGYSMEFFQQCWEQSKEIW